MINGEFTEISLQDYRGKYLVFFFYPLDFTFVCPTEILAFNDRVAEFRKIGAEVVACSVDSHFTHLAWMNTPRKEGGLGKLDIPLLSDLTHTISKGESGILNIDPIFIQQHTVFRLWSLPGGERPHPQRTLHHRRQGGPQADHDERPARRKVCR